MISTLSNSRATVKSSEAKKSKSRVDVPHISLTIGDSISESNPPVVPDQKRNHLKKADVTRKRQLKLHKKGLHRMKAPELESRRKEAESRRSLPVGSAPQKKTKKKKDRNVSARVSDQTKSRSHEFNYPRGFTQKKPRVIAETPLKILTSGRPNVQEMLMSRKGSKSKSSGQVKRVKHHRMGT